MDIVYLDDKIVVCIKPAGVLSTDEPGGMPELLRAELGGEIRTVHRLDRVVSGLMLLARSQETASALSKSIRDEQFKKQYLAVVHGNCPDNGRMTDLLLRDKALKKTFVVTEGAKGVQEAILDYETIERSGGMSLVRIELVTGRTHQIRCQFSSRGLPIVGDRKYGSKEDGCDIALWSHLLRFEHPETHSLMHFTRLPYGGFPWDSFPQLYANGK